MTNRSSGLFFLRYTFIFSLFLIGNFSQAQTWLWGKQSKEGGGVYSISLNSDAAGNAYQCGYFGNTSGDHYTAIFGSDTISTDNSGMGFYVTKYNPEGDVLWAKSSGQQSGCYTNAISSATDASGNTYVLCVFDSTVTFGSFTIPGSGNLLIVKYDPDGNVVWAKNTGSEGRNMKGIRGASIATDLSSNIYLTGTFDSTSTIGSFTLIPKESFGAEASMPNVFTAKYNSSGTVLWAKSSNGSSQGNSITTDHSGNVIVTGQFSEVSVSFGIHTLTNKRINYSPYQTDIFVVKYDPNGNVMWAKTTGGGKYAGASGYGGWVNAKDIETDLSGNTYITGAFTDSTLIFGTDTIIKYTSPNSYYFYSFFVAKYDVNGNVLWAKGVGGNSDAFGTSIVTDEQQSVYVSGSWNYDAIDTFRISFDSIVLASPPHTVRQPFFVVKYTSDGKALCASAKPSGGFIYQSNPIALGPEGSIYLTGSSFGALSMFGPDTLIFGTDTLSDDQAYYYAFMGRYQGCENPNPPLLPCAELFIPNVFSPNGDGENDLFYFSSACLKEQTFTIYNRWGEEVFKTTNPEVGWYGTWEGKALNAGVFFYTLNGVLSDGNSFVKNGNITLVH